MHTLPYCVYIIGIHNTNDGFWVADSFLVDIILFRSLEICVIAQFLTTKTDDCCLYHLCICTTEQLED